MRNFTITIIGPRSILGNALFSHLKSFLQPNLKVEALSSTSFRTKQSTTELAFFFSFPIRNIDGNKNPLRTEVAKAYSEYLFDLNVAISKSKTFIYISSSAVYKSSVLDRTPSIEATSQDSVYGVLKSLAEDVVLSKGGKVVRLPKVVSSKSEVVERVINGSSLFLDIDRFFSPISINYCTESLASLVNFYLLDKPLEPQIIHFAPIDKVSYYSFFRELYVNLGLEFPRTSRFGDRAGYDHLTPCAFCLSNGVQRTTTDALEYLSRSISL